MIDLPRDFRETVIRLDHDAKTAEVWTEQRGVLSRLKRSGFTLISKSGRGEWWRGPLRGVLIRKVPLRSGSGRVGGFPVQTAKPEVQP